MFKILLPDVFKILLPDVFKILLPDVFKILLPDVFKILLFRIQIFRISIWVADTIFKSTYMG